MSADNWHTVARIEDEDKEWGIFYMSGDGHDEFTRNHAECTYSNPIHAILEAFRVDAGETEYGVSVHPDVIFDTRDYFDYNTNNIVKAGRRR